MNTVDKKKSGSKRSVQLFFLPYISLRCDLNLGSVLFWSFYEKKEEYIPDQLLKAEMENLIKRWVKNTKEQEPLEAVTVVSYGSPESCRPLTEKQFQDVKDAITILCFSTIIRNTELCAFSSDDFQLVSLDFFPGSERISLTSGSYIRRNIVGLRIDEVIFPTPYYISSGGNLPAERLSGIIYDEKVLEALARLLQHRSNRRFCRRIITSLEWIAYSYTNVNNFNYASRIIMLATAFEILLDGFNNRFGFMRKIKNLTCGSLDLQWKDRIDNTRMRSARKIYTEGRRQWMTFSFKEWWAYEFYDLRSHIVHGSRMKDKDFRNRKGKEYLLVGIAFFKECLKQLLTEHGYYAYDYTDEMLWAGIYDEI